MQSYSFDNSRKQDAAVTEIKVTRSIPDQSARKEGTVLNHPLKLGPSLDGMVDYGTRVGLGPSNRYGIGL